jgi:hypothetical protein
VTWRRLKRRIRRAVRRHPLASVLVVLGLLLLAGHAGQHAAAGHDTPAAAAVPASAGPYTPTSWAEAFIGGLRDPETSCNVAAVTAWEIAEGGNWANPAAYNPLNTTQYEPGAYSVNPDGVKAYPTWSEGLAANLTAITNGLYGPVLSALATGDNAQAVASAVAASPWGTEPFSANC